MRPLSVLIAAGIILVWPFSASSQVPKYGVDTGPETFPSTSSISPAQAAKGTDSGSGSYPGTEDVYQLTKPREIDERRMYEDIEIMRRLLNKKIAAHNCMSCHQAGPGAGGMPAGGGMFGGIGVGDDGSGFGAAASMEGMAEDPMPGIHFHATISSKESFARNNGVYLSGQGVVYQATLSFNWLHVHQIPTSKKTKQLSEWEQIRKQVQGKRPGKAASGMVFDHPGIEETILQVLAENGQHFSELAANESITVAIAFPVEKKISTTGFSDSDAGMAPGYGPSFPPDSINPQVSFGAEVGSPGKDYELLGDVNLKQGKIQSAIDAYQKALKHTSSSKKKASLYRKLVKAYMEHAAQHDAQKNIKDYNETVQTALEYLKKMADKQSQSKKETKKTSYLPTRLIITATKRDLDAVGKGSLSIAEFRKKVNVRWLRFSGDSGGNESSSISDKKK